MTNIINISYLLEAATDQLVSAELHDSIEELQLAQWETLWRPSLEAAIERLRKEGIPANQLPQERHWNWREKLSRIEELLAHQTYSLMCAGETQGLMAINLTKTARLKEQAGKPLVYVEYLETAPWNRKLLYSPRYFGVGPILLRAAIEQSLHDEFRGRIGLHSLPQADQFYIKCGMTDCGKDSGYQNLRYFEMTPEQAVSFIEKKGA